MKKINLLKRTAAMTLAILIAVISPLSYGEFSLCGMRVYAQSDMKYLKNIKAEAEGENDVKVSWEYIADEDLLKELPVGTYGVLVEETNGLSNQIVGKITVTGKMIPVELTTSEEEASEEETAEEQTSEEQTSEEITSESAQEESTTVKPTTENVDITAEQEVKEEAIEDSIEEEGEFIPYALELAGGEKEITIVDNASQCIFQGKKKQDKNYTVSFVHYDDTSFKVIQSKESINLSYQAVCSVIFDITGKGAVQYNGTEVKNGEEIALQNSQRYFEILSDESGMWRLDESKIHTDSVGGKVEKRKDNSDVFEISNVTGDIRISVVFVEKLEKPRLMENALSPKEEEPTKLSEPTRVYLEMKADVSYYYTLDGSDPKTSGTVKKYTEEGIFVDSYEAVASVAVYAKEKGKDDSDVSIWYAHIIPNEPRVSNQDIRFSEGTYTPDTDYIKTIDGTGEFIVNHARDAKDNYQLKLGLMLNNEEKEPAKIRYETRRKNRK